MSDEREKHEVSLGDEDPAGSAARLSSRERTIYAELSERDPSSGGLFLLGHELIRRVDEPGVVFVLAHVGRELSRSVLRGLAPYPGAPETPAAMDADHKQRIADALDLPTDHSRVTAWFELHAEFAASCHNNVTAQ